MATYDPPYNDAEFIRYWKALSKTERDNLLEQERIDGFNRYVSLITHKDVDVAAQEALWSAAGTDAPPPPRKGNGAHPDAPQTHLGPIVSAETLGIIGRRVSEVPFKPVKWLWKGKIPSGKITIIQGNPGLGKSQICASLAAVVTIGGAWPVTRDQAPVGSVLILSAEDDVDDTIGPRLEAAGADCSRVYTIDAVRVEDDQGDEITRGFDLGQDMVRLIARMQEIGDVRLVIIDPVSAYMGKLDSHKNSDVRGAMERLKDAASRVGAGIILINHINKTEGQNALSRGQGSVAFGAAARAVWGVAPDKEDPQRRYFMPLKSNLGPDKSGFAFSIEEFTLSETDTVITTSRILWEAQPITKDVEELFRGAEPDEEKSLTSDAKEFLLDALSQGPVSVHDLELSSRKAGHKWHNVQRAKRLLNIGKPIKRGFGASGSWAWELPATAKPRTYANRDD